MSLEPMRVSTSAQKVCARAREFYVAVGMRLASRSRCFGVSAARIVLLEQATHSMQSARAAVYGASGSAARWLTARQVRVRHVVVVEAALACLQLHVVEKEGAQCANVAWEVGAQLHEQLLCRLAHCTRCNDSHVR